MQIAIDEARLYGLIKKAVREAIKEEEFALFLARIPEVSDEEMEEINAIGEIPDISDVACEEVIEVGNGDSDFPSKPSDLPKNTAYMRRFRNPWGFS